MIMLYFYDENLNLINKGRFDISQLNQLFDERFSHQNAHFTNMEQMVSKTSFCLSRNELDFLAMDCQENGKVSIQSDRLHYPTDFWGKLRDFFRNKNCLSGEVDLATAKIMCQDYVKLDRQTFEQKYQMFYSY